MLSSLSLSRVLEHQYIAILMVVAPLSRELWSTSHSILSPQTQCHLQGRHKVSFLRPLSGYIPRGDHEP